MHHILAIKVQKFTLICQCK